MEILDPVIPITLADLSLRCNEFIPKVRPILVQERYILESGEEETEEAEQKGTNMNGKLYFTSPEHRQRFLTAMQQYEKIDGEHFDRKYGAVHYILTSDEDTWETVPQHIERSAIDFKAIFSLPCWSGGYVVLLKLAWNLFNGGEHVDPIELCRLDGKNIPVALSAIDLRCNGLDRFAQHRGGGNSAAFSPEPLDEKVS